MSVVQNPITGRTLGKYANAVFSKWKDKNTLRSKPISVAQPDSPAQLTQRSAFAIAVLYARMILVLLRYSFKYVAQSMSEFNMFIKLNIAFVDSDTGRIAIGSEALLRFASGALSSLIGYSINSAIPSELTISWDETFMAAERNLDDKVVVFVYNSTQNKMHAIDSDELYSAGTGIYPLVSTVGDVLFVYAAVCRASLSSFSPSIYVGTATVA